MPQQPTEEQKRALQEKLKNMSPEELKEFQKQQCVFCRIADGKIPSKKIYEDDLCLAVLDINPAQKGHLLLLPKEHHFIMPQLPPKTLERLAIVSKYLSHALLKSLEADGTTIFIANGAVAGQQSQHFLMHLIPRFEGDNFLDLTNKKIPEDIIKKVKAHIQPKINEAFGIKKDFVQEEKPEEKKENKEQSKKEEPKEKPKEKEEEKEPEEEPKEKKEDSKPDLDQISGLFKNGM